jgi:antibiotic biosynthesis monooxygenase (ABM) superfamily enzyme
MNKKSGYGKHSSKEVTEVICRNIAAGHEKDYDDWLERFMISERQFPGYLGTTIIAPGGNTSSDSASCPWIIYHIIPKSISKNVHNLDVC